MLQQTLKQSTKIKIAIVPLAFALLSGWNQSAHSQTQSPKQQPVVPALQTPVPDSPHVTTASYNDWTLRCSTPANSKIKSCEIVQTVQVQGQATPFAQFGLALVPAKKNNLFVVVLPNNISFSSVPVMKIDDKETTESKFEWRRCLPLGCVAETSLLSATLMQLRSESSKGMIQFKDGAERTIAVPMSLRGFTQALAALEASQ